MQTEAFLKFFTDYTDDKARAQAVQIRHPQRESTVTTIHCVSHRKASAEGIKDREAYLAEREAHCGARKGNTAACALTHDERAHQFA